MTAVLAAAGRLAARFALAAALILICLAAMLFTAFGPGGAWRVAWIVLVAAVTGCATLAWFARPTRTVPVPWPCNCWCSCPVPCQRDDDGTPGWCDPCRMNIHQET